jgi:ATP adenylyltransferase/5',5'''-P-1,P-4-tetraphosphate phosphorylase II
LGGTQVAYEAGRQATDIGPVRDPYSFEHHLQFLTFPENFVSKSLISLPDLLNKFIRTLDKLPLVGISWSH